MIGAGGYAYELLKRMWEIPEAIEVVGVSSNPTRKSAGRSVCQERGIPVFDTVDQLLEGVKGKADVVFVSTPIHTHFDLTKQCLEAGFYVWLEKPPVATIQELDGLIGLAKQYNRPIAVSFQYLYTSILQELKSRIVGGEFGKVKRVTGMAAWPRDDSYYARSGWAGQVRVNGDWVLDGTINNPLAHMLSAQLFLASSQTGLLATIKSVEAELYHGHAIVSEDTSSLRLITDDNVEVLFNASLCPANEVNPNIKVECQNGVIEYVNFNSATITWNNGKVEKIVDDSEQRIYMLSKLAEGFENGAQYASTVESCRPFTIAVNAAFESCGMPKDIDDKYIVRSEHGDSVKTVIKGIDHVLQVAYDNGRLFSEMGVTWAKPSEKINVIGYKHFSGELLNDAGSSSKDK